VQLPDPKKPTYNLKELKEKWKCPMSDLFYFAEADKLQICKQQHRSDVSLFASDDEKEAASEFSKDIIPIDYQEASQIYTKYGSYSAYNDSYPDQGEPISLVITHEEKKKLDEKYGNSSKPHTQEKYPSLLPVEMGEKPLNKLKDIALYLGITPDYLKHTWKKKNCPINKDSRIAYAYPSQLNKWRPTKK